MAIEQSGRCRCALTGVPCRLRMLSIFGTFDNMLKLTTSPEACWNWPPPGHTYEGTPTTAWNKQLYSFKRGVLREVAIVVCRRAGDAIWSALAHTANLLRQRKSQWRSASEDRGMEYRIKDIGRTNDAEVPLPMTLRVLARNLAGRSVPILPFLGLSCWRLAVPQLGPGWPTSSTLHGTRCATLRGTVILYYVISWYIQL